MGNAMQIRGAVNPVLQQVGPRPSIRGSLELGSMSALLFFFFFFFF